MGCTSPGGKLGPLLFLGRPSTLVRRDLRPSMLRLPPAVPGRDRPPPAVFGRDPPTRSLNGGGGLSTRLNGGGGFPYPAMLPIVSGLAESAVVDVVGGRNSIVMSGCGD